MKLHFQNAYSHELDLLQAFRDRIAGLSLEAPRALMPPGTTQQTRIHYSVQGPLPPPQQQLLPLTAMSYDQMGFQGQYQTGAWPSQVTLGVGGHGAHFGASSALQPLPQSIPIRDENAPTSSLEHYPDTFLPTHPMAVGGALEDLPPYAPQEQGLMVLLQNNGHVGEH